MNHISPLPYPISRRVRVTIMLTLIGVFCLITPLVLLYARGFTFDKNAKKIIHGGAVSIETHPSEVNVFINDIKMDSEPPLRLPNVLPGNYRLKIFRAGYYPWEKDIQVVRNQTTYAHDIDLFKIGKIIGVSTTEKKINQVFPSEATGSFVFTTQEEETYELYLFDRLSEKQTLLTRLMADAAPTIEWSPDGEMLLIEFLRSGRSHILLMGVQNATPIQTAVLTNTQNFFQWENGALTTGLLFQDGNTIKRIDLGSTKTLTTLSTSTQAWFVDDQKILWEYRTNTLKRYSLNGEALSFFSITRPVRQFIHLNEKRLVGLNEKEVVIYSFKNNDEKVSEEVFTAARVYFEKKHNYHLFWSDGELRSINPNGQVTLINRFSSDIQNIFTLTDSGTLLIVTQNKLITFHPNYYVTHELVSTETIETVTIDQKQREIYWLGMVEGVRGVWKVGY